MRLFIILALVAYGFGKKLDPDYFAVTNSFGCDKIAIVNDTVRLDTNCTGGYDKKVTSDTSNAIDVGLYDHIGYIWNMTSPEATADSATYMDEVLCYDNQMAKWMPATGWTSGLGIDSIVTPVINALQAGQKELRVSVCDKIKFVFKVLSASSHSDTINVVKRYIRAQAEK